MALEQKQKAYNWYYTQAFVTLADRTYSWTVLFVTFAKTPKEAKDLAYQYVKNMPELSGKHWSLSEDDIHLYQKNYIRKSRRMVEEGKIAGTPPINL